MTLKQTFFHVVYSRWKGLAPILMYHRVRDASFDPWGMSVSPANFESQLEHLAQNTTVVPLADLVDRIRARKSIRRMVAITFDDGYADNFSIAAPILRRHRMPATFYIPTQNLAAPKPFWWDLLAEIVLTTRKLPFVLELKAAKHFFRYYLHGMENLSDSMLHQAMSWISGGPYTNRRSKFLWDVRCFLYPLAPAEQSELMEKIVRWAGVENHGEAEVMTAEQLRALDADGLFEIGAHSVNHVALPQQPAAEQWNEISESKRVLDAALGKSTVSFSYPFGVTDRTSAELVENAGFAYAVTTRRAPAFPRSRVFHLPRCLVGNWDRTVFSSKLDGWFQGAAG